MGPLTWETPELRQLYKLYWQVNRPQICRDEIDLYHQSAYDDFFQDSGYLDASTPSEQEMLNNDIHPIFDKSNWMVEFDDFDEWYTEATPAFQLASMFLSHPHMLKFWIHLKYGHPGFKNGWVAVEEDPTEHDPNILDKIKEELQQVAGQIKFAFRVKEDMGDYAGTYEPGLRFARGKFEDAVKMSNLDYPKGLWYNPWDTTASHTIFFDVKDYTEGFLQSTPSLKLSGWMYFAMLIVHELAHACTKLWQPDVCGYYEPVPQSADKFPEAGLSWEQFAFGGIIIRDWQGPACFMDWEHAYPSDVSHQLPIAIPVPVSYFMQWFYRDTWEHLTDRLPQLRVPNLTEHTHTYLIKRLRGEYWEEHLIVDGEAWPAAHLVAYEGHPLEDKEYTPGPEEPSIPTTAADIISRFQAIHAIDVARSSKLQRAPTKHCYWHLTKLCCPYSQIHQLADNALNPADGASPERYYEVDGCLYCWQLPEDEDYDAHPVPYSQRFETEQPSKRALFTRKSKPVRCGLPQRTTRQPAGRSIAKAKLEHVNPACVTPGLQQLFREGTDDGGEMGVQIGLEVGQAVAGYPKVRGCGLLMLISEPVSRLAQWLHLR